MTNKQLETQIRKLMKDYYSKRVIEVSKRLINSGAIDPSKEDIRSPALPKAVLKAALEDTAAEISLFSDEYFKEYQNLKNF